MKMATLKLRYHATIRFAYALRVQLLCQEIQAKTSIVLLYHKQVKTLQIIIKVILLLSVMVDSCV